MLAQVHKATAAVAQDDDLDLDPALATCVQLGLAGPHLAPPPEPAVRPALTESAIDAAVHLHRVIHRPAAAGGAWVPVATGGAMRRHEGTQAGHELVDAHDSFMRLLLYAV